MPERTLDIRWQRQQLQVQSLNSWDDVDFYSNQNLEDE